MLKPALTCEVFIHLLQSSDSFFALAGFYVDIVEGISLSILADNIMHLI